MLIATTTTKKRPVKIFPINTVEPFQKRVLVDETFPAYHTTNIGHDNKNLPSKRLVFDNASSIAVRKPTPASELLRQDWFQT